MKTLIIYDDNGIIYSSPITGNYTKPIGELHYLEIEIPKGQILKGVDVFTIPHSPIYEDVPTPEIDILKQQLKENQELITEYVNNKYNSLLNY